VSNVSYGLSHDARRVLNSVFLHEAVKYGLDAAIVHPKQILPLHKIDKEASGLALDLIYCKDKKALNRFMEYFDGLTEKGPGEKKRMAQKVTLSKGPPEERLRTKIIDGDRHDMEAVILEVLKKITPQDAINNILLPAMKKVGEMFGAGELALPFVLQSAETMRLATDILTPHLKKGGAPAAGTMVLATVVGDVHDIGKNLVDIIVSNNGYKVVNLGVKQPVENIMRAAKDHKADAIGLSGLLVQSCLVMKENLIEMARAGMKVPVICGGAALTKKFVESDLSKAYNGRVYYAKDAFDGLKIMQTVTSG
jgi:5-methyltetrahydrofolate--homocysteine methyltransferase